MIKLIECMRTFQGEGPDSGRAMLLLRFKHCNNNCFFCDTSVQMRISQEGSYTIQQLQEYLDDFRCGVLITGGEPTFTYQYNATIKLLQELIYPVANVETNGFKLWELLQTKLFDHRPVKFIYSPKIFSANNLVRARDLTLLLLGHPQVYFKIPYWEDTFVDKYCAWLADLISTREKDGECNPHAYDNKIYLMPLGSKAEDQKQNSAEVMDACEKYKFNFTGRLHTMYEFI